MSILLPAKPGVRTAKPRLVDVGAVQRSPLGATAQRLNRPGNHFAIDVEAPTSRGGDIGRVLIARLILGMEEGLILPFVQDFKPCVSPDPVVDGAGQAGRTLNLRGWQAAAWAKEGQFFSIIQGGRRYVHMITAQSFAGTDGKMAASIYPMLRVPLDDGAVCEFQLPMIEGFMVGDNLEWQIQTAPFIDVTFSVEEAA
jgi:hypothetical protein